MMCLSVVTSNESVAECAPPETPLIGVDLLGDCDIEVDAGIGKRRKMSKTDSPNSSCFDVATLIDAIHREVEGDDVSKPEPIDSSFGDDFCFIDISE